MINDWKYQPIVRDFNFTVKEDVPYGEVADKIKLLGSEDFRLIGLYEQSGIKTFTIRFNFRSVSDIENIKLASD